MGKTKTTTSSAPTDQSGRRHAFDVLAAVAPAELPATIAVAGDDRFLKRLVLTWLMGDTTDWSRHAGEQLAWRDLADELLTRSLFTTGRRHLLVEDADSFVSRHRQDLERYFSGPADASVLVLDLQSLPSNTNLAKLALQSGWIIECRVPEVAGSKNKSPDTARMRQWLSARAKAVHQAELEPAAWDLLIDLVGWELGLLDQELAKLALFVTTGERVTAALVQQVVGGWRTQTTWDMMDAALDGRTAQALGQLDQLLQAGEAPLALFGSVAWSLRRFAMATRIHEHRERGGRSPELNESLEQAGFRNWPPGAIQRAATQLKRMGRPRAGELYRWVLETDLALKGSHSQADRARQALEMLLFRLAGPKPKR